MESILSNNFDIHGKSFDVDLNESSIFWGSDHEGEEISEWVYHKKSKYNLKKNYL